MPKKDTVRFRTNFNIPLHGPEFEPKTGESETIPDETLTIEELISRTQRGIPLQSMVNVRTPHYHDSDSFDDVDPTMDPNFDLADMSEIAEEIVERKELEEAENNKEPEPEPAQVNDEQNDDKPITEPEEGS